MHNQDRFGTEPLGKLLREQAIPASIGILIMSIYMIVDTIFVGRYVGSIGIAAITVVMPISFLIASVGMAIGVGGASIISRAYGAQNMGRASVAFGNQITLTIVLSIVFVTLGFIFQDEILILFGGKGKILGPARDYFHILLYGVPFLAWAMMSNNVIRAEGAPRKAMLVLVVPAVANLILDPIFIIWLKMGIEGAAWATTLSYVASATYGLFFFFSKDSDLKPTRKCLVLNSKIVKEILSIGSVTLARQGTISILAIVANNNIFTYGGEAAVSTYGIVSRTMMFANFPVMGITQGFLPIVGFNYGAALWGRVRKMITLSIGSATVIALGIFMGIMIFAPQLAGLFTNEQSLIDATVPAMRWIFLATPLIAINLLGSAYFQAIGKARPALLLTLTKQGFFLIPLILFMPGVFGLNGIWYSFPIADLGAAAISFYFLRRERASLPKGEPEPTPAPIAEK